MIALFAEYYLFVSLSEVSSICMCEPERSHSLLVRTLTECLVWLYNLIGHAYV